MLKIQMHKHKQSVINATDSCTCEPTNPSQSELANRNERVVADFVSLALQMFVQLRNECCNNRQQHNCV